MLPEVRVIIERAAARRASFEGLAAAVPGEYWLRRAKDGGWTAGEHLAHVARIDELTSATLSMILAGSEAAWIAGATTGEALTERRAALLDGREVAGFAAVREGMHVQRARLVALLGQLGARHMEARVFVAGVVDGWGEPVAWELRRYLAAIPEHDSEHEAAIRRAVSSAPDLSAVAVAQRAARRH